MSEARGLARGGEALELLLGQADVKTVLDVGSGAGEHAALLRAQGRTVMTVSLAPGADYVGDFLGWTDPRCDFDAVWACHVLEHQVNPGAFLRECRRRLRPGGLFAVTVPPLRPAIVGGHVSLWNAGLLLYQLVLAGFDCRQARVGTYGYNISVLVANQPASLPELACDDGDIERLAEFFPIPVRQGFDGNLPDVGWNLAGTRKPWPKHIAILGMGPSLEEYVRVAKRRGGRREFCDEVWGINAVGDVVACDRIFHMDDVRIQEIRAAAAPDSNIAGMLQWIKRHPGPIYTSRSHPDYPGLVDYPLEAVVNSTGYTYMNSTAAHAVAYAVHLNIVSGGQAAQKISCFGMDFTYPNAHDAEKGRACVEFWLGMAAARGVRLGVAKGSSLIDAVAPFHERLYGYDTLDVKMTRESEGAPLRIAFSEKTGPLPSAEEIEARYDHSQHPNPLIEQPVDQAAEAELVELIAYLERGGELHRAAGREAEAVKCQRYAAFLKSEEGSTNG